MSTGLAQISIADGSFETTIGQAPASPWTVGTLTGGSTVLVTPASQSPFTSGGSGVTLNDLDHATNSPSGTPSLAYGLASGIGAGDYTLSFDFQAASFVNSGGQTSGFAVGLMDSDSKIAAKIFINRILGKLQAFNGTTIVDLADITAGTWYNVSVDLSQDTKTYGVVLTAYGETSVTVASGFNYNNSATVIRRLFIDDTNANVAGGAMHFDNFTLLPTPIPEPSSMALVGGVLSLALVTSRRAIRK